MSTIIHKGKLGLLQTSVNWLHMMEICKYKTARINTSESTAH